MKENIRTIVIIVLLLALGLSAWKIISMNDNLKEQETLQEALNAKLDVWKAKDGLNHAKIQVLETRNTRDFLSLQTNDATVKELQRTVKEFEKYLKKQGSATVVTTSTDVDTSSETEVTFLPGDSIFPVYTSQFNLKGWVIGETRANKDSTNLTMSIKNEYSVIIGREKQGLFKPDKPFVEVVNKNPYTQVKSLRTYEVSLPATKRWGVGPVGAYGIGLSGTPEFKGFIGIGVQYSLIKF
jgi:hypothetical protein